MDASLWGEIAKNGIFAVAAAFIAWTLWKEMRRMSDEARAREERISAEARTERERMHSEAIAQEDRLMRLAEGLTDRFEALAGQYKGLALDVHEIKSSINGKDAA